MFSDWFRFDWKTFFFFEYACVAKRIIIYSRARGLYFNLLTYLEGMSDVVVLVSVVALAAAEVEVVVVANIPVGLALLPLFGCQGNIHIK